MATLTEHELLRFHQFISETLNSGNARMSPEEALELWREGHPMPDEFDEAVADLHESFADMKEGDRGVPLNQFDQEFRQLHLMDTSPQ